jgi:hypothetical protein
VWEKVVRESASYGMSRDMLRKIAYDLQEGPFYEGESDLRQGNWSPRILRGIDSDHWAGSLARGAYHKAEQISEMSSPERQQAADKLRNQIEDVFSKVPRLQVTGETIVRHLEEFLNLPIWKHRHELYSVWISTQILNALDRMSTRIHQVNGNLIFSFSGTHLATSDAFEPRLHVWAELRSPLIGPIGKSRKSAIQPDYSLITDPVTSPEASILEVECKQYIRPSVANFSAALLDYAKGRPNVHVILVNYGPANQSILNNLDPYIRLRTSLIDIMRPDSKTAQDEFRWIIHEVLTRRYGSYRKINSEKLDLTSARRIVLSWREQPRDLDLHLIIDTIEGDIYKVNFSERGDIIKIPWAQLNDDERYGHGPEVIKVNRWIDGRYHFAVHNYSNDCALIGCGASVTFDCGHHHCSFQYPIEGNGRWWSVFALDTKSGTIDIINKVVEDLGQE